MWPVRTNKEQTSRDGGRGVRVSDRVAWWGLPGGGLKLPRFGSEGATHSWRGDPRGRRFLDRPWPLRHNQHHWRWHCGLWCSRSFSSHGLHHRMESGTCGERKRGLMLVRGADTQLEVCGDPARAAAMGSCVRVSGEGGRRPQCPSDPPAGSRTIFRPKGQRHGLSPKQQEPKLRLAWVAPEATQRS